MFSFVSSSDVTLTGWVKLITLQSNHQIIRNSESVRCGQTISEAQNVATRKEVGCAHLVK